MASGPTFQLPDALEVPPSSDGEDFEVLATLRRMPDGSVQLVAVDGNEFPTAAPTEEPPSNEAEEDLPGGPAPDGTSPLDAIESRLDGVPPSEISM